MDTHPYFPPGVFIDTELAYKEVPACTTTAQIADKETLRADLQKVIDLIAAEEAKRSRYPITVPVPKWFYDMYRDDFLKDTESVKYVALPEKFEGGRDVRCSKN